MTLQIMDAFVIMKNYISKELINNKMLVNHDRYIILDKTEVYISGMSFKDIGKKYTYINKVNESIFINELLKRINNVL